VQRAKQPVTASVAGEDSPSPVAAVGRRRKTNNKQPRPDVAEAGDWPAPVFVVVEAPNLLSSGLLTPLDQSRAKTAADYSILERIPSFGLSSSARLEFVGFYRL
jgi:hypothetical protein